MQAVGDLDAGVISEAARQLSGQAGRRLKFWVWATGPLALPGRGLQPPHRELACFLQSRHGRANNTDTRTTITPKSSQPQP